METTWRYALDYHSLGKTGKIEIQSTKQLGSADALSIAYSPGVAPFPFPSLTVWMGGVAEPCLAIKNDPVVSIGADQLHEQVLDVIAILLITHQHRLSVRTSERNGWADLQLQSLLHSRHER